MTTDDSHKKAIAFFDGQNLFHSVKEAFGYSYPNYDPKSLAKSICKLRGWELIQTRFYTGIPKPDDNKFWNNFWTKKLLYMRRKGIYVFSRPIRYIHKEKTLPDGTKDSVLVGDEKGIDVRIAIDIITLAIKKRYDVALIFSQDQDLSEAAHEIRNITKENDQWIKLASAFPKNTFKKHLNRGINKTDWLPFEKSLYDTCIDPRDYRLIPENQRHK